MRLSLLPDPWGCGRVTLIRFTFLVHGHDWTWKTRTISEGRLLADYHMSAPSVQSVQSVQSGALAGGCQGGVVESV